MAKIYISDVGTNIRIDMQEAMASATGLSFDVKKPNGTFDTFTPIVINGDFLEYITVADDINVIGDWDINPILTISGWTGRGETVSFEVFDKFK